MIKFWAGVVALSICGAAFAGKDTTTDANSKWIIVVDKDFKTVAPMFQAKKDNRPTWGVSVGAYFPADEDLRDLFGDTLIRFGLSPTSRKFDKKFDIVTDVNILWANDNGARLFVLPLTIGGLVGFGNDATKMYVAVNAGPAYFDYRLFRVVNVDAPQDGEVIAEFRDSGFGWNANIEGGVLISDRLSITGRYDWFKKWDDFDFGGFSININYAFFKW